MLNINIFEKAKREYKENGAVTSGTLGMIINNYKELLPLFADENNFK